MEEEQTMLHTTGDGFEETTNTNVNAYSPEGLPPDLVGSEDHVPSKLGLHATAKLSIKFCILWVSNRTELGMYVKGLLKS